MFEVDKQHGRGAKLNNQKKHQRVVFGVEILYLNSTLMLAFPPAHVLSPKPEETGNTANRRKL